MRHHVYFSKSPAVIDLYNCFRLSQGKLYHYTSEHAAASISHRGELWLTRADSFLDPMEVQHGINLLRSAAESCATFDVKCRLLELLEDLSASLRNCYVLSLTNNPSSDYLTREYGQNILELRGDFTTNLSYSAWHSVARGDGFESHFFLNLYKAIEGFVVYDPDVQRRIAEKTIAALQEVIGKSAEVVDVFHMHHLMITCIMLFKRQSYAQEEEYRVVLHRHDGTNAQRFCEQRLATDGRSISYVRAVIPHFSRDLLTAIRVATIEKAS